MHTLDPLPYFPARNFTPEEAQARATAWLLTGSSIYEWVPISTVTWEVRWEQQIREAAKRIQDADT